MVPDGRGALRRRVGAQPLGVLGDTGVEVAIDAGSLGKVALFATRSADAAAHAPAIVRSPEAVTVYWTAGRGAYALSGSGSEPDLGRAAATLAALQH